MGEQLREVFDEEITQQSKLLKQRLDNEIIQLISKELSSIKTKHLLELNVLKSILINHENDSQKIKRLLTEMIKLFCNKCREYNRKQFIPFFQPRKNPIDLLNEESTIHKLTRGIGYILQAFKHDAMLSRYLEAEYQMNVEHAINEYFEEGNSEKNTLNLSKLNRKTFA